MIRLAIDCGSQFVDLALAGPEGIRLRKLPVGDRTSGAAILDAFDEALVMWALDPGKLDRIHIATTAAVNALLNQNGPAIGLMTTAGFGDLMHLGRQDRAHLYEPVARPATPSFLVRRENIAEIGGRLDALGGQVEPLDRNDVQEAAVRFRQEGIEAVAVCFLFAHVNPVHETECATILAEMLGGIDICLSHRIDPYGREYERAVSTCLEAWLRPGMTHLLDKLVAGLERRGFVGRLRVADSRAALLDIPTARRKVSSLLTSGPAVSALAASDVAHRAGTRSALSVDIGSTSTDMALMESGEPGLVHGSVVATVPLRQSMSDVECIALGGMSRFSLDPDGYPVPAFGQYEAWPAVNLNDCLVMLDRLPDNVAERARERLDAVAPNSGCETVEEAARRIVVRAEDEITSALMKYAVRRNVDPASVPLIVMGGLGPVLGPSIATRLGTTHLVMTATPSATGAVALLGATPGLDALIRVDRTIAELDAGDLQTIARQLVKQAKSGLTDDQSRDWTSRYTIRIAANPHMHALTVPLGEEIGSPDRLFDQYCRFHERICGVKPPGPGFVFSFSVRLLAETTDREKTGLVVSKDEPAEGEEFRPFLTPVDVSRFAAGWEIADTQAGFYSLLCRHDHA